MKNSFKLLLIILVLIFAFQFSIFSQNSYKPINTVVKSGEPSGKGSITGVVMDKESAKPVEYANIVLFSAHDSTMVGGTISDNKGYFIIDKVPFGKYYMVISFIGFNNLKLPEIILDQKAYVKNLGQILFTPSVNNLDAVSINAEKSLVQFSLDKKIVNVEKNLVSAGGSAVDVLQNVPSVTVDIDGNVSLRGSTNITILIDGRPSTMSGASRQAVLEQIPASSIETIELITNPSAKYNPEGMSGIINIKLKKKVAGGLNGVATASVGSSNRISSSLNLNYSTTKYNIFGSWDGRWNTMKFLHDNYRRATIQDTIFNTYQQGDGTRKMVDNSFKVGVDIYLNKRNTLTISGQFGIDNADRPLTLTSKTFNYSNQLSDYFIKSNDETENENTQTYTLNYKKTFEQKNRELTLDVSYNYNNYDEMTDMKEVYYNNDLSPSLTPPLKQLQDDKGSNYVVNILLNYVHPISDKIKLETGYQGIIRNVDNIFTIKNFNDSTGQWMSNEFAYNNFIYNENYHALYGTLSKEWESGFSAQIGLRAEQALTTSEQVTQKDKIENNYFSLYPSVHISKKLPKNNELQLSYSRRVNRPDIYSLNPFKDYSNPLNISFGNPYLKPEYINSIEIGHSKNWSKTSLMSTVFYRQINDVMKRISWMDTLGISYSTTQNLSKGVSYGVELIADQELTKWWRLNISFSYFRTIIEGNINDGSITNDNYSWTSKINSSMNLNKGLSIQISGNYRAPIVTPQGKMFAMYSADIAVKKDLLKDILSMSVRLSDIFNTQRFEFESSGDNFYSKMQRKRLSRVLYLSITYKINGGLKQKPVKRSNDNSGGDMGDKDF